MLCHFRFSHSALCFIVALLLLGDARAQTQGYSASREPVSLNAAVAGGSSTASKIDILVEALRRSPDDPVVLNNLAVLYGADGQSDKAIETGLRAVEVMPDSAVIRVNLAALYDRAGKTELARTQAAEAVRLDAGNTRARGLLCELELVTEHTPEAVECYRELNNDFPGNNDFQLKYGITLLKAAQWSEARRLLEGMLRTNDRDTRVLNVLANVCYKMKDFERSSELLKSAVEIDPDNPKLRYNLGISYLATKNRPAALSQYNMIKQSSPDLAQRLYRSLFQKYILDVRK